MAKFILPDNSPQNKKRMVAASGGYAAPESSTVKKGNSINSTLVNLPITRNAQFAGSGAGIAMSQPMFFSPLHTPQNWQIASRRREIMQWSRFYYMNEPKVAAGVDFYCFEPNSQVLMSSGTQKSISSIIEGDYVRSHDGSSNIVEKVHRREASEDMLKIKIAGVSMGTMKVTKGHDILTERDGEIKFVKASSLSKGDYLLTPCNYEDESSHSVTNDFAWLLGVYASEGCGIPYTHTSKKSRYSQYFNGVVFTISMEEKETLAEEIKAKVKSVYPGKKVIIREVPENGRIEVKVFGQDIADDMVGHCPGTAKFGDKKFINTVLKWNNKNLKHLLSGYFSGDGCFNIKNGFQGVGVARKMMDQLANICDRLGIEYSYTQTRLSKYNRQTIYNIRISRRACRIFEGLSYKYKLNEIDNSKIRNTPYFVKNNYIYRKILNIKEYYYSGDVYDLTISNKSSYVVHRVAVHNSNFSMNGFKLECKSKKILKFYERLVEKIDLAEKLNAISHEYFLLGDVFPFTEIDCPTCGGSGRRGDGELCNHADGTFKTIKLMNPDYLDVKDNPLASNPEYYLIPDEELKLIVQRKEPVSIYESLPVGLIKAVSSGQPIRLSDRCISHLKHNASDYGTYGTSMLQRLFTVLAYKTKIMTANWIVAERLILPVRVVKVGDKDRPATDADLQDVQSQLSAVANDPNLTIVTHHAFDYEWYGACYSEDTEILTEEGWKYFNEINRYEKVATYNQKNGEMEYQLPTEYHEYDFESTFLRKMFHFNHKSQDILVTPNHRMLVERKGELKEVYSQHVKHDDKFISTMDWSGKIPVDLPYIGSSLCHLSLDEYLEFVGYYLSEGSLKIERNKGLSKSKQVRACCIAQSESSEYFLNIQNNVSLVYPSFSDHIDDRNENICHDFIINNADIARYMEEEFGTHSHNKRIPKWIKNLPKDKIEILYKAMMDGDGGVRSDGLMPRYRYSTTSKGLADDFSEICLKLGYFANTSIEKTKKINRRNIYRINFSEKRKEVKFNIRKKHIQQEDYNGKVYCVKVPNSWVVVRRCGKISVCGNTGKIHNITQEIEQIGKEILDGLMLNQAILNGEMAGYSCLSADTTTLCDSGFKHYWEIDPKKDKIACYNDQTKKIEYHFPYEKVVYDYKGEMVHFNTDKIDILVTPNHRMWSAKRNSKEYKFTRADKVRPRAKFIGAVEGYDGEYQKSIQIGEEEYSIYNYCKLVGYYVSEGWTSGYKLKSGEKVRSITGVSQNKNGKARSDIENLFEDMFDNSYTSDTSVCRSGKELSKHLCNDFGTGAINKKLSSFVKNLSTECLEIVLDAMVNGDGCVHNHTGENRGVNGISYYTSSPQLANDFAEIAFKCGYVVKIREYNKKESKNKVYFNKRGHQYKTNHQQYVVYISKGFKGRTPTLHSKSKKYSGKEITRVPYSGKVYCFSVPYEKFVTMRNGAVTIQGNSAQVGIEVLIRRLDNWRNKLKDWVETHIFKPIAMMQGFVDEQESKEANETVYLYPKLTWNDLQLRDKTNRIQTLMQMYDKGMVSAQTVLEEMDLDYDSEVEKIREEQILAQANGMVAPMGGDAMGGAPMGGGPMGGDMGGGMPGMDGGMGGAPMGGAPGGDMGGGMGGAPMGGAPGGAPMGAAASGEMPTIGKRGSKNKQQEEEQQAPPPQMIKLTKLEQKMFRTLSAMDTPHDLFAQYQVRVPGESRPYAIDFAYPKIGVGIECLHPETYVQTINGSKQAKDINIGEYLIGRNGSPVEVKEKFINKSKGKLLDIKSHGMDKLKVTENHPLLICKPKQIRIKREEPKITRTREYMIPDEPSFVNAGEVKKGDYIVVPKDRNLHHGETVDWIDLSAYRGRVHNAHMLPLSVELDNEMGWFFGIYGAEGCSSGTKNKVVEFSFHIDEVAYSDKVQNILQNRFGINSSVSVCIDQNSRKVICSCTSLGLFLRESFGYKAPNKGLPSFMFSSSVECKEGYLEAYNAGDGCIRSDGTIRYQSSSKKMLLDMQALSFSIGRFSNFQISRKPGKVCIFAGKNGKEDREYVTAGLWEMTTKLDSAKKQYREDDNNFYVPVMYIVEDNYEGDVINFETIGKGDNNHTYLVSNMVTHNCDGAIWHEREDFKQRDLNRDQKLANVGWRVLRFNEDSVNENIDEVTNIIVQHIADATKSRKAAESEGLVKTASKEEEWMNPLYEYCLSKGKIGCKRAFIPHGQILYIGNIDNGEDT